MPRSDLAFLQRYTPLLIAEYERIGMAAEMERYFTGSGDAAITEANCENALRNLRAIPPGIGFDAYCARVGMDANAIRTVYAQSQLHAPPDSERHSDLSALSHVIDTVPRPKPNLLEMLAARARHASDGRLATDAIGGITAAALVAYWSGPAWEILLSVATCFYCFGVWGIADRELGERPDATPRTTLALRAVRVAAVVVGFSAATFLALATLASALGRIIS